LVFRFGFQVLVFKSWFSSFGFQVFLGFGFQVFLGFDFRMLSSFGFQVFLGFGFQMLSSFGFQVSFQVLVFKLWFSSLVVFDGTSFL